MKYLLAVLLFRNNEVFSTRGASLIGMRVIGFLPYFAAFSCRLAATSVPANSKIYLKMYRIDIQESSERKEQSFKQQNEIKTCEIWLLYMRPKNFNSRRMEGNLLPPALVDIEHRHILGIW